MDMEYIVMNLMVLSTMTPRETAKWHLLPTIIQST